MKKCGLSMLLLGLALSFDACSGGSQEVASGEDEPAAQDSGNRFYDAAVAKVQGANPGFTADQAKCVVDAMTAEGKYGLGEINSLDFQAALAENASGLVAAYHEAVKSCAGE